jgi:hypothetical protein
MLLFCSIILCIFLNLIQNFSRPKLIQKIDTRASIARMRWWRGQVVSSLPDTGETEALGREIESRQGIGW